MTGPLLSTSPLPLPGRLGPALTGWTVQAARPERLAGAAGLLLPHDGLPVADVRAHPERWETLTLLTAALRRGVPVLGWGSGAALLGRALGAAVTAPDGSAPDRSALPRGAQAHAWTAGQPTHWTVDRAVAWAGADLPPPLLGAFLAALPGWADRRPGSPLEEVGGATAVREVVTAFYARARTDDLLGPVFAAHVADWPAHLDRVTAFWVTLLGGEPGWAAWRGNLNSAHAGLGVRAAHLGRWLTLWDATARAVLPAEAAALLSARAAVMGERLGRAPGARAGTSQAGGA
ncbi:group III truncated hemoglobin [Deinococcus aquaticus]|uniref:Group III truncated hemoglobin n=1 Tax=Deinococcus aquaticus TaxID=328692 RepID=A0ABY7UXV4_9DEIO|nr:group III truncated hemoglobin [Deinococcus aquaticus]WDA57739.1 group III truncated hemoglobin [Deinococcus aquaticus]